MTRAHPGCATAIRSMTSFLGVPIIFKGRLLGNLYLDRQDRRRGIL